MAPSVVTPVKYCSMSSTFTSSLATAITRRAGWEIVQWTGIRRASVAAVGGHGRIGAAALRAERRQSDAAVVLLDQRQLLEARHRGRAQLVRLGNPVRNASQRCVFIGTERGKQTTFHGHLQLTEI